MTGCAVVETLLEEDTNHAIIRHSQSVLMHLTSKLLHDFSKKNKQLCPSQFLGK